MYDSNSYNSVLQEKVWFDKAIKSELKNVFIKLFGYSLISFLIIAKNRIDFMDYHLMISFSFFICKHKTGFNYPLITMIHFPYFYLQR